MVSITSYGLSRLLIKGNIVSMDLSDGIVIAASLPMTVNMVIVMTKQSGGNEAVALLNASLGSMIGVFITPALILIYLGQESDIQFGKIVLKLVYRVIIPIIFG